MRNDMEVRGRERNEVREKYIVKMLKKKPLRKIVI